MRKVIALQDGFINGARVRKGEKFKVGDNVTGRWFVDEDKYVEPAPKPYFDADRQGVKARAQSFVTLMKQGAPDDTPVPETLSEAAKGVVPKKFDPALLTGKK